MKAMPGKTKTRASDESLDRLGRAVVRAASANEGEAEAAASSPFLYARVRSRIAAERERREGVAGWLALFGVAWRAVPALALVAVFAFALSLSVSLRTGAPAGFSVESLVGAGDAEVEEVVFAERRAPMSSDEVLATILGDDEREDSR